MPLVGLHVAWSLLKALTVGWINSSISFIDSLALLAVVAPFLLGLGSLGLSGFQGCFGTEAAVMKNHHHNGFA